MGVWSDFTGFIRDTFSRDQVAREQAAADVDLGDYPVDLFGNLAIQAMGHGLTQDHLMLNNALMARFIDYERMDEYPDCSAALNIYSDDATVLDSTKKHVMWSECKDDIIRRSLDNMMHKKVHVDDEAWESIRMLCKYGNCFEEVLVSERGVEGLNYLPPPTIRRLESDRGGLKGFVQSFRGNFQIPTEAIGKLEFKRGVGKDPRSGVVLFEPWRIVHMRLRSARRRAMYGIGLLEPARWVWRRLTLLEDAALISRLARAPSRFAFYVDVGKMPTQRAEKYLDEIRRKMKKRKFVNPKTGKLDLRYNPLATDEDFFLPVRESREIVRADVLNTPQWTGVEDVEYFRNKLHAALMVPRAYLGYDENMPSRATLSQEDVRFARSVLRLQKEYRNGIYQVCKVHLASQGIDPAYVDFQLAMTVPSSIFELAQLEVQSTRAQFAQMMGELVSKHWILSKVFGLSDGEIEEIMKQREEDLKTAMGGQGGQMEGRFDSAYPRFGTYNPRVRNQRVLNAARSQLYPLEQDLFAGDNPTAQRRLEGRMDRILHENRSLAGQLTQLSGFMNDLRSVIRPQASQM
jgi:hypothetical protein